MAAAFDNHWVRLGRGAPGRLRLFCLPYAGAGASIYRQWAALLPPEVEVWCIQLPGREDRIREPPFVRMAPLVVTLAKVLTPHLDLSFAFFGHSMGALMSFELARELRRTSRRAPAHVFVSGHRAPQLPDADPPIHALSDDLFLGALDRLHGGPSEALQHPELQRLLIPTLRADLALCETYEYRPEPPLDSTITAFGGESDQRVPVESLLPWAEHARRGFSVQTFPGDHFYLSTARDQVLRALSVELTRSIEAQEQRLPRHA